VRRNKTAQPLALSSVTVEGNLASKTVADKNNGYLGNGEPV